MENKTDENTLLINELNNLRVEKKTLIEIKSSLESQLKLFVKKNKNLEKEIERVQDQLKEKIEKTKGDVSEAKVQIKEIGAKYGQYLNGQSVFLSNREKDRLLEYLFKQVKIQ